MRGSSFSGCSMLTFSGSSLNISSTVGIMLVPRRTAWLFRLESGERTGSSQPPKPGGATSGTWSNSWRAQGMCNDSCLGEKRMNKAWNRIET